MPDCETFHHELTPNEYAVLIDAQFQAAAAAISVDAFKNNVPSGDRRALWWDDHLSLTAWAQHAGEQNTGNSGLNRLFYRKIVSLTAYVTGEGVDTGFSQDTQLVGTPDGGHTYELLTRTTAEDLEGCPISKDDLLRVVRLATNNYVLEATGEANLSPYTPTVQPEYVLTG
jgi:hypothetical protein